MYFSAFRAFRELKQQLSGIPKKSSDLQTLSDPQEETEIPENQKCRYGNSVLMLSG